jgi:N-acetylmuramoyl-L-alanine amidase
VDAGHGGKDSGAVVNGISEKDILYAISQKIKENAEENVEIILLRENDQFVSLRERAEKINSIKPDLVISLHVDNNEKNKKSSTKAYIYKNKHLKQSFYYAKKLLDELNPVDNDIEFAGFYVLKASDSPALNLSLGNLSNVIDYEFLTSDVGQTYISEQIIKGLQ